MPACGQLRFVPWSCAECGRELWVPLGSPLEVDGRCGQCWGRWLNRKREPWEL